MRRLTFLGLLLLLAFSLPPTVVAVDPDLSDLVDDPVVRLRSGEEAAAEDLSKAAMALGWSTEQASAYADAEAELNRIAEEIATKRADVFIGTALPRNPLDASVVFVKGEADEFIRNVVASSRVKIDLRDNQPYSLTELKARAREAVEALDAAGLKESTTFPDFFHPETVMVEVVAPGREASAIASVLPTAIRDAANVTVVDKVLGHPEGAYGGMRTRVNNANECTSGFTVEHLSTGSRGVASAGHCSSSVNQIVHVDHDVHGATVQASYLGQHGDFQWMKTNQPEADDFVSAPGVVTDVSAIETVNGISLNELVCAYGTASNDDDCTLRTSALWVNCTVSLGDMIRMDGDTQVPGDSGGPWYRGGRAYGVHRGGCGTVLNDHFSMVDYLDNTLNVAVQLN